MSSNDATGFKDTLTATYTGLGHLYTSRLSQQGTILNGYPRTQITNETFSMDAMANRYGSLTADTSKNSSGSCIGPFDCSWRRDSSAYESGVGRLLRHYVPSSQGGWVIETSKYDSAGNITVVTNPGFSFFDPASERILMYAADGQLRAVHYRWVAIAAGDSKFHDRKYTFEEYRYDALGRRIWYRSVKTCYNPAANMEFYQQAECVTSLIRRTIWNGDQELAEIQMLGDTTTPATTLENDLNALNLPIFSSWYSPAIYVDQNPYIGHVIYTPGRGLDKPLAATRYNYLYKTDRTGIPITTQVPGPLTIMPFWNARGDANIGAFANGAWKVCNPPTSQTVCVGVVWMYFFSAYDRNRGSTWDNWHGTILEGKRDKSGLSYRRNRYYDPGTGRFTQEDPIGLAGGLNLYSFANGDPVNFSDPFGLAADTLKVDKSIEPQVTNCKKKSEECRERLEELENSTEYWEITKGSPGDCDPYIIGCTDHTPVQGHGPGGTITIIPGEFKKVKFLVNSVAAIGHEAGHATTDQFKQCINTEACSIKVEQIVRKQAGLPPRP